jgi:hypothetical protein
MSLREGPHAAILADHVGQTYGEFSPTMTAA